MTCRCQGGAHSTSDCVACSVDSTHRDETREAGQEPPEKPRIYDAHFVPCTLDLTPSWAPAPNKEGGPSPLVRRESVRQLGIKACIVHVDRGCVF